MFTMRLPKVDNPVLYMKYTPVKPMIDFPQSVNKITDDHQGREFS